MLLFTSLRGDRPTHGGGGGCIRGVSHISFKLDLKTPPKNFRQPQTHSDKSANNAQRTPASQTVPTVSVLAPTPPVNRTYKFLSG